MLALSDADSDADPEAEPLADPETDSDADSEADSLGLSPAAIVMVGRPIASTKSSAHIVDSVTL